MQMTVAEVAAKVGVSVGEANGFVKTLVKLGVVTTAGSRKNTTGKGKPSNLYEVPYQFEVKLG